MPAGERERAWRGFTHEPYECCGKAPGLRGRPKGKPCDECAALIADGRAAREKAERNRDTGALQPYTYHERDYATPHYYALGIPGIDHSLPAEARIDHGKSLQAAMFALVNAASEPAPATTPHYKAIIPKTTAGGWDERVPWPHVLSVKQADRHDWQTLRLMAPAVRDAIDALDQVLRAAFPATFTAGKREGRSLIKSLASGEVSLTDFDDSLLSADQLAERKKAR